MNWSVFQNRNILSASSRFKYFSVHYLPIYSVKLAFIIANVSYIYVCVYIYIYIGFLDCSASEKWGTGESNLIPGSARSLEKEMATTPVLPFMGFSRQEYWSGLLFPSPVDHILSELSNMTCLFWVALQGTAHSFTELAKAVVHVTSLVSFLWLWFSDCLPYHGER